MNCPECNEELIHEDTFGNLDYCMEAIGHQRQLGSPPRKPVKAGDIFRCEKCDDTYYKFDGSDDLNYWYPC